MLNDLTTAQKAAIYLHVFSGFDDWDELFKVAEGEKRYNNLTDKSKIVVVNRWKNSDLIQQAIQELRYKIKIDDEKKKNEIIANWKTENENRNKEGDLNESVNFLDRDEFLQFLNERANKITDDKLRNDILKMLSDNLRYKDSDNDQNNEIQRFYTPVTCENCPIYKKCGSCTVVNCPIEGLKC